MPQRGWLAPVPRCSCCIAVGCLRRQGRGARRHRQQRRRRAALPVLHSPDEVPRWSSSPPVRACTRRGSRARAPGRGPGRRPRRGSRCHRGRRPGRRRDPRASGARVDFARPRRSLAELATVSDALVVAVDLPSGVDADTGAAGDDAVWADVTVTFGLMKPGLLLSPGSMHVGLLELVDIGLGDDVVVPSITSLEASTSLRLLPRPGPLDHKYSQGVTGVVAGSERYPGAAVLAVAGALHVKAGLVRYVGDAAADVVRAWPSVIVSSGSVADAGRVQAWGVGPGLGLDDTAVRQLADVLARRRARGRRRRRSDACWPQSPDLLRARTAPTVLTPHEREFATSRPGSRRRGGPDHGCANAWRRGCAAPCCSRARRPSSPMPTARCG